MNSMEFGYSYSDGVKFTKIPSDHFVSGKTSTPNEIKPFLEKLTAAKASVSIEICGPKSGSIEFFCLEDCSIEMEILQGCDDDFACVDIPTAKNIIDVLFENKDQKPVRELLRNLPIKWA